MGLSESRSLQAADLAEYILCTRQQEVKGRAGEEVLASREEELFCPSDTGKAAGRKRPWGWVFLLFYDYLFIFSWCERQSDRQMEKASVYGFTPPGPAIAGAGLG